MSILRPVAALLLVSLSLASPLVAQRAREQDQAFDARRAGQVMSLRQIEAKVLPRMQGADYLGPEFDAASSTYRLKFMKAGSVIWIDVDAKTGNVIGRMGN